MKCLFSIHTPFNLRVTLAAKVIVINQNYEPPLLLNCTYNLSILHTSFWPTRNKMLPRNKKRIINIRKLDFLLLFQAGMHDGGGV